MTQKRIAEILNKGHKGDKWSVRVDLALALLILANLIAVVLESLESLNSRYSIFLAHSNFFQSASFLSSMSCASGPRPAVARSTQPQRAGNGYPTSQVSPA